MNTDDLLQLQQPIKDGAIRSVNLFNGRLLTSKDLSRDSLRAANGTRAWARPSATASPSGWRRRATST